MYPIEECSWCPRETALPVFTVISKTAVFYTHFCSGRGNGWRRRRLRPPFWNFFFSVYGLGHKEIEYPSKYCTMPNGLWPGRMPRRSVDVKAPERIYSIICKSYRMRVGSVRHQTRLHWTTDVLNRRSARLSIQKRVDLKRAMTNRLLYSTTSTRLYLKFFYFKLLLQCYFDVLDRTNVWHKSSCADPLMQSKNQPVYNRVWKIKMMEWSVKTKKHFFYALSFRRWA